MSGDALSPPDSTDNNGGTFVTPIGMTYGMAAVDHSIAQAPAEEPPAEMAEPTKNELKTHLEEISTSARHRAAKRGLASTPDNVTDLLQTFESVVINSDADFTTTMQKFVDLTDTDDYLTAHLFKLGVRGVILSPGKLAELLLDTLCGDHPSKPVTPTPGSSDVNLQAFITAATDKLVHTSGVGGGDLSQAREAIVASPPSFYFDPPVSFFGTAAIGLPPWTVVAMTGPLERTGITANPLMTAGRFGNILADVVKDRSLYPQARVGFVIAHGKVYCFHLAAHLLSGVEFQHASAAAADETGRVLSEGARIIPELRADVIELARAGAPSPLKILQALDRFFRPVLILGETEWYSLDARTGETGFELWLRVRELAAKVDKQYGETTTRMSTILHLLVTSKRGTDQVPVLAADFNKQKHTYQSSADLTAALQGETLYMIVLVKANERSRERPPRHEPDPTTLLNGKPIRMAMDITKGVDAWEKAKGETFNGGVIPNTKVQGDCVFCIKRGITTFLDWSPDAAVKPDNITSAWKHNPWKCVGYVKFVEQLCKEHPDINQEALLRKIENPTEVARADARVSA